MRDSDAFSLGALYAAAMRAARGKRRRPPVARFLLELEPALCTLRQELVTGTWRPCVPRLLSVCDPKPRTISVAPFRDRVVHQALAAVLAPRIERRLVSDSYACRPGLGTHAALARGRAWARTYRWFVHLDVAKYFPACDHGIISAQLAADHPEPWLRDLCGVILAAGVCERRRWHFPGDDLFAPLDRAVGLPLGNLTSQLWANRYLDPVDHFVKDRLRVRAYLRYMDDMLLFHDDPRRRRHRRLPHPARPGAGATLDRGARRAPVATPARQRGLPASPGRDIRALDIRRLLAIEAAHARPPRATVVVDSPRPG